MLCLIPFICDILLTILTIQNHDKMVINTMLTLLFVDGGPVAKAMGEEAGLTDMFGFAQASFHKYRTKSYKTKS
jgi:hypothetical protein